MAVVVTSTTILKPSPCRPHPLLHTRLPLTIFDRAAWGCHIPCLNAFWAPMPTNEVLTQGLADVLCHFPDLAGRMGVDEKGRPYILLSNAGVRVVEARVDAALADRLPLEACRELRELYPRMEQVEELLQVQLNRYSCGGLVIGVTNHHRVADGHSMNNFLVAWAAAIRGEAAAAPYLDRAAVFLPRNPPRCEFDHRVIEFMTKAEAAATPPASTGTVENLVLHFTTEFVAELKARILRDSEAAGGPPQYCSTFTCLLAHVWKMTTAARGVADEQFTKVTVSVNGRPRMKPAVPPEFFGNVVLSAFPRLRAGELKRRSLADVVKVIHDAVAQVGNDYFQSFVDFGAMAEGDGEETLVAREPQGDSMFPDLEAVSLLKFNFHELDFGTGKPCAFLLPNVPAVDGIMVFIPSCKDRGSVDVSIGLSRQHAEQFRQLCLESGSSQPGADGGGGQGGPSPLLNLVLPPEV